MNKLQPATNQSAYLKCGILGFSSSGKTFTAVNIAIGLHKYIKSKKPIGFLDTETGSDFLIHKFKDEKIDVLTAKSRAFKDLIEISREAEKSCDILIVDSLSHFWIDIVESFKKKKNLDRLFFQHWGPIKQEWRTFTDFYINSKLHIIVAGRAGYEYDYQEDAEGVKELIKTGTRMKTEGEMAYEPSLLLEMEKVRIGDGKIGQSFINRCWVIKDRFDKINGKYFDRPKFENFLPHIELLNLGGEHFGVDTKDSTSLFESKESKSEEFKKRKILLEEIQNEILLKYPSQTQEDRKAKVEILRAVFKTGSWTEIESFNSDQLEKGYLQIKSYGKES